MNEALESTTVVVEKSFANEFIDFALKQHRWISKLGYINVFASGTYPITEICLGRLGAGIFPDMGKVHVAAGAAVARELGLKVTDAAGKEIDWSGNSRIPLLVIAW